MTHSRRLAEGILFTDQYQLTMAQLYFLMGLHERESQFDHFFRSYPDYGAHQAGFCVNAGLDWLIGWMQEAHLCGTHRRPVGSIESEQNAQNTRIYCGAISPIECPRMGSGRAPASGREQ